MNITLNGESKHIQSTTVAGLVAELALNMRQVAVERNREIVPRSAYETVALAEGDVVEIVAFIGGG